MYSMVFIYFIEIVLNCNNMNATNVYLALKIGTINQSANFKRFIP